MLLAMRLWTCFEALYPDKRPDDDEPDQPEIAGLGLDEIVAASMMMADEAVVAEKKVKMAVPVLEVPVPAGLNSSENSLDLNLTSHCC